MRISDWSSDVCSSDLEAGAPGFFTTIFGALPDIPREQPIRDNLEAFDQLSSRIVHLRQVVEAMRPEVEAAIERVFGTTLLLGRPTPKRLAAWRSKAQTVAAREAGYAYAAYGHLKLSSVLEDVAGHIIRLSGGATRQRREAVRQALWNVADQAGLTSNEAMTAAGARADVIEFFRSFDLVYRTRRLRLLARRLGRMDEKPHAPRQAIEAARGAVYDLIGRYRAPMDTDSEVDLPIFQQAVEQPVDALEALTERLDLKRRDDEADARISEVLAAFPKAERRSLILTYLGFPFYDIATLPLLQGEGLDEFDPVKVDRIAPDDATAIREGGAEATLKGIQFNSFGAFFSRAYRENDYLWGRLHGADRLVDIVVSALPEGVHLPPGKVATLKREAFRAIVAEERERLTAIPSLFEELDREIGGEKAAESAAD